VASPMTCVVCMTYYISHIWASARRGSPHWSDGEPVPSSADLRSHTDQHDACTTVKIPQYASMYHPWRKVHRHGVLKGPQHSVMLSELCAGESELAVVLSQTLSEH